MSTKSLRKWGSPKPEPKAARAEMNKGSLKKSIKCRRHKDGKHVFDEWRDFYACYRIERCSCGKQGNRSQSPCKACGRWLDRDKGKDWTCKCGRTRSSLFCPEHLPKPFECNAWCPKVSTEVKSEEVKGL